MNPALAKTGNSVDIFIAVSAISLSAQAILGSITLALFPRLPILMGYSVPEKHFTVLVRMFCTFTYSTNSFTIVANFMVIIVIVFMYFFYMTILVTEEFRTFGNGNNIVSHRYRTISLLRTVPYTILEYRSTQILHQSFLEIFGFMLAPIHSLCTTIVIFCSFVIISYRHEIHSSEIFVLLLYIVVGGSYWFVVLEFGGLIYSKGGQVLLSWSVNDWGSAYNNKLMTKFRKSCPRFRINYGSTYVIRRTSVLAFVRSLSRGTFRALLTLVTHFQR